jgi:predicted amidohydrolase YtcJ
MYGKRTADLILLNANVITVDPFCHRAEAVAICRSRILGFGTNSEARNLAGARTRVIDCSGKTIVPGFIDSHLHLSAFAESLVTLNLEPRNNVHSITDIQAKIGQLSRKLPPGTWIRCGGYNEFHLREKRHPTRRDLDPASSTHPIKLTHRSGHAHVLNSLALKLTGITKETPDPDGGIIDRDFKTGEPTGLLYGMGDSLASLIPPLDAQQLDQAIEKASDELLSFGITSVHDASSRNDNVRWNRFKRWKAQGLLRQRVSVILGVKGFREYQKGVFSDEGDESFLRLGGVKMLVDEITGRLNPSQDELNDLVLAIHRSGLQAVIHAIEENPIEAACTAIEHALRQSPRPDHRHRIEHCSVCPLSLAKRIASLGISIVTQPSFIYYSGDRYLKTVPDLQLKHLYPIKTFVENGVHVAAGSDCPVAPADPLIGMYSAITRMAETGETLGLKEGISPAEALRLYTAYGARTSFEETTKGSITPGKVADLVVLSDAPTAVSPEEVKNITVEATILDGKVVWDRNGLTDDASFHV